MAMEAIGSTCNTRKLTGKGQVKGKHRGEAYGHQKLKRKENQGQGSGDPCTGLGCVCLEMAYSIRESSGRLSEPREASGNLREMLVRLYECYRI